MEEEKKQKNIFITDTIILAILSGTVYLATFFYEYGYCIHFNIPTNLISPNLTTILFFGFSITLFLWFTVNYLGLISPIVAIMKDPEKKDYRQFAFINLMFVIALIVTFVSYGPSMTFVWVSLVLAVVYLLVFGKTLLKDRKKPLKEKIKNFNIKPSRYPSLISYLSSQYFYAIIIITFLLILSLISGNGEASKQYNFPVIKNYKNLVVLRTYGDLLICTQYNSKTKTTKNEVLIINISKKDSLVLAVKSIGHLDVDLEWTGDKKTAKNKVSKVDSLKQ